MKKFFPPRLRPGDTVRIIAPSCTLTSIEWMNDELLARAKKFFIDLGMTVSEGKHIRERNAFDSTSIEHRIEDLHDAFRDPSVKLISTIRGGWSSNQLLRSIDYDLIRKHPKILCGFSDITALSNAIYAKTGLVGYSGPNFTHFAFGPQIRYSLDAFVRCVTTTEPIDVLPSAQWTRDRFSLDHQELHFERSDGWWILQEGEVSGTIIGANLCTFNLLHGTEYMPSLEGSILFLEDDYETHSKTFDRDLQSILHQPGFSGVRGIVIGRFESHAANAAMQPITRELLTEIVRSKRELRGLPVIANVDFGHTHPMITFPIGGRVEVKAGEESRIRIVAH